MIPLERSTKCSPWFSLSLHDWEKDCIYSSRQMFNNLAKLTKVLKKEIECDMFCFFSVGVLVVLRFLVKIKEFGQSKIFCVGNFFRITMFSWWCTWCFGIINIYQCFVTLNILFDEVDKGLWPEKKPHFVILFFLKNCYRWLKLIMCSYTCRG